MYYDYDLEPPDPEPPEQYYYPEPPDPEPPEPWLLDLDTSYIGNTQNNNYIIWPDVDLALRAQEIPSLKIELSPSLVVHLDVARKAQADQKTGMLHFMLGLTVLVGLVLLLVKSCQ